MQSATRDIQHWVLGLFGVGLLLLGCAQAKPQAIVARVDDMEIRVGDVQEVILREKDKYDPKSLKSSKKFLKIKQRLLNDMIDRKLLLREATRREITISDDELEKEIRKYKSYYTEMAFQKMLQERNISYEAWVALRKESYLINQFLQNATLDKQEISEETIEKYYREHPDEFKIPESVRVRQMVTDTKEKAEAILRRLRNGENFAKLARDLSLSPDRKQGGDLGFIPRGSFPREFEVCFTMNPGEISPIMPSIYGFHIFKVLEKAAANTLSFDEAREKIVVKLTQEAHEQTAKQVLQELRQGAQIRIDEKILEGIYL